MGKNKLCQKIGFTIFCCICIVLIKVSVFIKKTITLFSKNVTLFTVDYNVLPGAMRNNGIKYVHINSLLILQYSRGNFTALAQQQTYLCTLTGL